MNNKAQSTFEYILLVTAVIVVILAFVSQGGFRNKIEDVVNGSIDQIQNLTNDVAFDVPDSGINFDPDPSAGGNNGAPPEGWIPLAPLDCVGVQEPLPVVGYDSSGLPLFSPVEEFVGNDCDYLAPNPSGVGELRFDATGTLLIKNHQEEWVPFDWNNWSHPTIAFNYQRYGPAWDRGCGIGGHITDMAGAFEKLFGRRPTCTEITDQYYGNVPFEGLTGEFAIYNGLNLMQALEKKNLLSALDPQDPTYVETPKSPGPGAVGWGREQWLNFYNASRKYKLDLPFTLADIDAAFPS